MFLLVLGHVDDDQVAVAAVEDVREGQHGLRLAHAARADHEEHADRPPRIHQVGPGRADALGDRLQGMPLADDALFQFFLEREHGLDFVEHHLTDGDAGPPGHHGGHGMAIDHGLHERRLPLELGEHALLLIEGAPLLLLFRGGQPILGTALGLQAGRVSFETAAQLLDFLNQFPFLAPAFFQPRQPVFLGFLPCRQVVQAFLVLCPDRLLALENAHFDVHMLNDAPAILQRCRRRRLAQADAGAGGVQQADRLVRQLPVSDVALRQFDSVLDGLVEDAHLVVLLERGRQAAHHAHGLDLIRFFDLDNLKAALECGIGLEIFLVFAPGGGRDGPQLAARQGGLEQVGRIALSRRAAGADHGVCLVDEQDDRLRGRLDLRQHRLETIFEFTLDAGASLQQPEVERAHRHPLEGRRYIAGHHAQREPFHHGGLAHARLAGQDRIVLPPAGEDVDDLPDFKVPADHRIDLPLAGPLREIHRELVQGARRTTCWSGRSRLAGGRRTGLTFGFHRAFHECGHFRLQAFSRDLAQFRAACA